VHDRGDVGVLQGWHADPFGRFDERYFSQGTPTALVRGDGSETHDEPTERVEVTPLEPLISAEPVTFVVEPACEEYEAQVETFAPSGPRPRLFVRPQHRVLGPIVLIVALVVPVVVWEMLLTQTYRRLFTIGDFAFIAVALTMIVWTSRRGRRSRSDLSRRPG